MESQDRRQTERGKIIERTLPREGRGKRWTGKDSIVSTKALSRLQSGRLQGEGRFCSRVGWILCFVRIGEVGRLCFFFAKGK